MKNKNLFLDDRFILTLIILNALVIFIQEFKHVPPFVYYLDNIFTLLFSIEVIVKTHTYTFKQYWKSNWNRLDFILILLAVFSMVLELFNAQLGGSLGFVTSLRVLRFFKSFRLIKFVPNIRSILAGVNQAIKASYVIIIAFIILLFICAVLTCALFKEIAPEYFDTPLNSLYTVFRIFSIEGWYEIPDAIAERTTPFISFLSKFYFVLLLFGGGILGMSLINSIFVDAMVSDNNDELEKEVKSLNEKVDQLLEEIRNLKKTQ